MISILETKGAKLMFCLIILLHFEYFSHDTIILFFSFLPKKICIFCLF